MKIFFGVCFDIALNDRKVSIVTPVKDEINSMLSMIQENKSRTYETFFDLWLNKCIILKAPKLKLWFIFLFNSALKIVTRSSYFPATGIFKSSFSFSRLFKFSVKTKHSKILVMYKKSSSRTKQELSEVGIFQRTCKNKERRDLHNFVEN